MASFATSKTDVQFYAEKFGVSTNKLKQAGLFDNNGNMYRINNTGTLGLSTFKRLWNNVTGKSNNDKAWVDLQNAMWRNASGDANFTTKWLRESVSHVTEGTKSHTDHILELQHLGDYLEKTKISDEVYSELYKAINNVDINCEPALPSHNRDYKTMNANIIKGKMMEYGDVTINQGKNSGKNMKRSDIVRDYGNMMKVQSDYAFKIGKECKIPEAKKNIQRIG